MYHCLIFCRIIFLRLPPSGPVHTKFGVNKKRRPQQDSVRRIRNVKAGKGGRETATSLFSRNGYAWSLFVRSHGMVSFDRRVTPWDSVCF